jgi:uncharacterized OsmC-like protein
MSLEPTNAASSAPRARNKPDPQPRNGVDVPTLFATINGVREQRDLAQFQFRASNRWIKGTHSRTRMLPFSGAGGEFVHAEEFAYDADHHPVLCGDDEGATPVEFLLHALASCLTAGIANIASARGINLTEVESRIEGDIDLQGLLGLSEEVRNGYQGLRIQFRIRGDAGAEELRKVVEQSRNRSAVFDVLRNGTEVDIDVDAG